MPMFRSKTMPMFQSKTMPMFRRKIVPPSTPEEGGVNILMLLLALVLDTSFPQCGAM
jgi:hypothetical protein